MEEENKNISSNKKYRDKFISFLILLCFVKFIRIFNLFYIAVKSLKFDYYNPII